MAFCPSPHTPTACSFGHSGLVMHGKRWVGGGTSGPKLKTSVRNIPPSLLYDDGHSLFCPPLVHIQDGKACNETEKKIKDRIARVFLLLEWTCAWLCKKRRERKNNSAHASWLSPWLYLAHLSNLGFFGFFWNSYSHWWNLSNPRGQQQILDQECGCN